MKHFFLEFLRIYWQYCQEIWLTIAIGFLLSGIFYICIPGHFVDKYLGKKGMKPIFLASIVGIILPVCCIGALPIAITLKRKGASLGSVLAFLVATPATSITALIVCWRLLGWSFTIAIFLAAIFMALLMGLVTSGIAFQQKSKDQKMSGDEACCQTSQEPHENVKIIHKKTSPVKAALSYAFITLPKEMGLEILLGIAFASFIVVFDPLQHFIRDYLTGLLGYGAVVVVGLFSYVCSTASVPMADALITSGMSQGQALCYLLVGPITSYGTILVIRKDFGMHVITVYLTIICVVSLFCGITFDILNLQY